MKFLLINSCDVGCIEEEGIVFVLIILIAFQLNVIVVLCSIHV